MRKPIEEKHIALMTRREFEELPHRRFGEDIGAFTSLIILPTKNAADMHTEGDHKSLATNVAERILDGDKNSHLHDSGYRIMQFIAAKDGHPICRLGGSSDVVHIEGIGGRLHIPTEDSFAWSIDCLPTSGLLRLYCLAKYIKVGEDLSSFDVFGVG